MIRRLTTYKYATLVWIRRYVVVYEDCRYKDSAQYCTVYEEYLYDDIAVVVLQRTVRRIRDTKISLQRDQKEESTPKQTADRKSESFFCCADRTAERKRLAGRERSRIHPVQHRKAEVQIIGRKMQREASLRFREEKKRYGKRPVGREDFF